MFRLADMASAAVQIRKDEDVLTKVLEVLNTNPLLALEHPGSLDVREEQVVEVKVPKKLAPLKEELEAAQSTLYDALQQRDIETFLANEIIREFDWLDLEWVLTVLLNDIIEEQSA